jgi:hypothetical protein
VFEFWKGTSARKEESDHHYQSIPSTFYYPKWCAKYTDNVIDMFRSFYSTGYSHTFRKNLYYINQADQLIANASPQQVDFGCYSQLTRK